MQVVALEPEEIEPLLQHFPDFVVLVNDCAQYVWVNRLDPCLTRDDVVGKRIDTFVHEDFKETALSNVRHTLETGEPRYYEVFGFGNGASKTVYGCRVVPAPTAADGSPRALILCSDVSKRHAAEARLAKSEALLRSLVESSPSWIVLVDRSFRITYLNHPPPAELGLSIDDVVGMSIANYISPTYRENALRCIEDAFRLNKPFRYQSRSSISDRRFQVDVVPSGENVLLVTYDVTEQMQMIEERDAMLAELDDRTKKIQTQLREKDMLLREIHHRVKNNLQVVSSLLFLQQKSASDPAAVHALEDSRARIRAFSLVHEKLYATEDIVNVDIGEYANELASACLAAHGLAERVTLNLRGASFSLELEEAIPCGLIINELLTNAMKHAFPEQRAGSITISTEVTPSYRSIAIRDDGIGKQVSPDYSQSLGEKLIAGLARQLRADVLECTSEGTSVELRLPVARDHAVTS